MKRSIEALKLAGDICDLLKEKKVDPRLAVVSLSMLLNTLGKNIGLNNENLHHVLNIMEKKNENDE